MGNEETKTSTNTWGWIFPSIVSLVIFKVFGLAGGLITMVLFFVLQKKLGLWFAALVSTAIGVAVAMAFMVMLRANTNHKTTQQPTYLPTQSDPQPIALQNIDGENKRAYNISYGIIPDWFLSAPKWQEDEAVNDKWFFKSYNKEIFGALGFYIGEGIVAEKMCENSIINTQIRGSRIILQKRYGPAVDEIKTICIANGITEEKYNELMQTMQAGINQKISDGTMPSPEKFADVLRERVELGYEGGNHKFLMAVHPENNNNPLLEYSLGLTKRIETAKYAKFKANIPVILIPASWTIKEGNGEHVAVTCSDARSQLVFMVSVYRIAESTLANSESLLNEMIEGLYEEKEKPVQHGFTKVNGKNAAWWFQKSKRISAESVTYQRLVAVAVPIDGVVYQLMFRADSVLSETNAENRMCRFMPLIKKILSVATIK